MEITPKKATATQPRYHTWRTVVLLKLQTRGAARRRREHLARRPVLGRPRLTALDPSRGWGATTEQHARGSGRRGVVASSTHGEGRRMRCVAGQVKAAPRS